MPLDPYWTEALSWLSSLSSEEASFQLIIPDDLIAPLQEGRAVRAEKKADERIWGYRQLSEPGNDMEVDRCTLVLLHRGLEEDWPDPVRIALMLEQFEHLHENDVFSFIRFTDACDLTSTRHNAKSATAALSDAERSFLAARRNSNRRLLQSLLHRNRFDSASTRYQLDALLARMIGTKGWDSETSPNTSAVGNELRDFKLIKTNIKVLAWKVEQLEAMLQRPGVSKGVVLPIRQCLESAALGYPPSTKICTASDLDADWHRNLCALIGATNPLLRKLWEWTYSLKVLSDLGAFQRKGSGLGFGCGSEPMASLCANFAQHVLVTDAPPDVIDGKGWSDTNQHTASLSDARFPALAPGVDLNAVLGFEFVDMNAIPDHLHDRFAFVWSSCALEHIGSKRAGLAFIVNSLRCLKPGGVAVHTTEYDLSGSSTIDDWATVLFNQNDFELVLPGLVRELEQSQPGHSYELMPLKLERGQAFLDGYVDIPPYAYHPSLNTSFSPDQDKNYGYPMLNLSVDGFPCTSIAVVIRRLS